MICEDHSSPTYDCDDVDLCWLEAVNKQKKLKGLLGSSTKLGPVTFVPPWICVAISKSEVVTSEDLQKAIVAFELKVRLIVKSVSLFLSFFIYF